jgi:hypothetical protein
MYYSVHNGDLGNVLLDGVRQKYCCECDTKEGYVIRFVIKDNGDASHNYGYADQEKVKGEVRFIPRITWEEYVDLHMWQ